MKLWRYGVAIERLGQRYRLDGVLGSGGMADVCLAWDEREGHEVAVKVIKPDELNQRSLDRFLKEAAQVSRWRHPHVVRIYGDVRLELLDGTQGSVVPYIVMEYAQGGDLQKRLQPGVPYSFAETLHIFEQLCQSVSYAHSQGIIHRDLKPLNILFRILPDQTEQMILSDFGLAVEVAATHFTFAAGGTLPYMAPEQLRGHAEPASDIFALGVILYQLCTGRYPFRRTIQDLRQRGPLPPPPLPSSIYRLLPPELDDVILTALSEDPSDRFADALDFWEGVNSVIDADTLEAISRHQSLLYSSHSAQSSISNVPASPSHPSNPSPILLGFASNNLLPVPPVVQTRILRNFTPGTNAHQTLNSLTSRVESHNFDSAVADVQTHAPFLSQQISSRRSNSDQQSIASVYSSTPLPAVAPQHPGIARNSARPKGLILWLSPLLLLLLLGSLFLAYHYSTSSSLLPASTTITLIPASKLITNTYMITGVTTPPDPTQLQIAARQLTSTNQSQPQTVQGTGHMQTPGSVAKGTLTFFNGSFANPFSVSVSIPISGPNGVEILTDTPFTIPAGDAKAAKDGMITVPAHATKIGAQGNIGSTTINQICCTNDNSVAVKNTAAFTGGQDPKDYTFVQQSDVDRAINLSRSTALQQAQTGLQKQVQLPYELAGTAQCTDNKQVDPATVGDKGQNIPSTTVLLKVQCAQLAYDKNAAVSLAQAHLRQQAGSDPQISSGYTLAGNISTTVTVGTVSQQSVALQVQAQGRWIYSITAAQKQAFARLVAGKSSVQARSVLMQQAGIANVLVTTSGTQNNYLPNDVTHISVDVQKN